MPPAKMVQYLFVELLSTDSIKKRWWMPVYVTKSHMVDNLYTEHPIIIMVHVS